MRLLLMILILYLSESCSYDSDKEKLVEYYQKSNVAESIINDSNENSITRYDDLGFSIDKHWFDEKNEIYLYTFYNRFYETDKAALKVRFNKRDEIVEFEGEPFYVSSNLIGNDTLLMDTVQAYVYLANSPFLNPEVKILTENITRDIEYVIEETNLNYVLYFEDYPDSLLQNIMYTFFYTINVSNYQYRDSLIYDSYLMKK